MARTTAKKTTRTAPSVTGELQQVLEDTYSCFLLTHFCHWNVEGPQFMSLHTLFEQQYTEMFAAIDEIAERMRALKAYPFKSGYSRVSKAMLTLPAVAGNASANARKMVEQVLKSNEVLVKSLQSAKSAAEETDDAETADMMTARIQLHQKAIWMLRASIA